MAPTKQVNGRDVKWVKLQVRDAPAWIEAADSHDLSKPIRKMRTPHEEYWVPRQIEQAWLDMRTKGGDVLRFGGRDDANVIAKTWFRFADFTTAAQLATMAEATRHSLRVLALASSIPAAGFNKSDAAARFLVPYFGIRGLRMRQMANAYNLPEAQSLEHWMARVNALPTRAYEETRHSFSPDTKAGRVGNWFFKQVHKGREFLFDLPELEAKSFKEMWDAHGAVKGTFKGFRSGPLGLPVPRRLWGFDVRARVVATKIFFENLKVSGRIPENMNID